MHGQREVTQRSVEHTPMSVCPPLGQQASLQEQVAIQQQTWPWKPGELFLPCITEV